MKVTKQIVGNSSKLDSQIDVFNSSMLIDNYVIPWYKTVRAIDVGRRIWAMAIR